MDFPTFPASYHGMISASLLSLFRRCLSRATLLTPVFNSNVLTKLAYSDISDWPSPGVGMQPGVIPPVGVASPSEWTRVSETWQRLGAWAAVAGGILVFVGLLLLALADLRYSAGYELASGPGPALLQAIFQERAVGELVLGLGALLGFAGTSVALTGRR